MSRTITCENFMERLEGMTTDAMPGEELVRLEKHAENCSDCAMLLRMHAHLSDESLADLETRVPETMVAGMWSRLTVEMAGRNRGSGYDSPPISWLRRLETLLKSQPRPAQRWLVPALAAGVMILLFGGGYLLGEVNQLKERERLLVNSLLKYEQLAATRAGTRPTWWGLAPDERQVSDLHRVSGWLRSSDVSRSERAGLARALAQEEDMTVSQLTNLLARMHPRAVVLDAGTIRAGRWQQPYQRELLRIAAAVGIPIEDGLQAAEALQILEALNLKPERTFSMTRLLVLATGQSPGEFSRAGRRVRPLGGS